MRHLEKPFSEAQLVDTLADVLAERRRMRDDRHLKVLIETMQRAGRSEREIVARVRRETAAE